MKKIYALIFSASLALTQANTANAHNFQNEACDVNVNGEIVIANNTVTITTDNNDVVLFSQAGDATVNGTTLALNSEEKQTVSAYVEGIEDAIPQALELAAKAIKITNDALTEVFVGLLGENSRLPKMLNEKLNQLQQKLESHIYQQPGAVTFDSAFFGASDGAKTEFEKDLDIAVEEVMSSAMAELLVEMGKSMLSGGANMQDFEQRMDNMGDNIDKAVAQESQKLKDDAIKLCDSLEKIDAHETKLQQIDELKQLNFFTVKPKRA